MVMAPPGLSGPAGMRTVGSSSSAATSMGTASGGTLARGDATGRAELVLAGATMSATSFSVAAFSLGGGFSGAAEDDSLDWRLPSSDRLPCDDWAALSAA